MYRTIQDFKADWKYESEMTSKIFGRLTDASPSRRMHPEGRTLGFLAWHIVESLGMASEAGLPFQLPEECRGQPPSDAALVPKAYEKSALDLDGDFVKRRRKERR